jgi:hypothetical protein
MLGRRIMGYMTRLDWAGLGKAGSRAARAWTVAFLGIFAAWVVVIVVFELIE